MTEWVRCNSCCTKPGKQRFYLTNCGHLFCEGCMKESPETCKLCKNSCKAIMLTSQMKPEVEEYFIDIPTLLNRQQKKLLQVYEFQRTHWKSFVSLHEKQEAILEKTQKRSVDLEREVALLREENNQLRRLLSESKQHHTPGKNTAHSPGLALRRGVSNVSPIPYSNSPYGMAVTSTPQQDGMHQRQPQVRTPAGPSRLTVRTPPSNGMIGTTRPSPYMHSQRPGSAGNTPGGLISQRLTSAGNTPGGLRTANTPGPHEPVTPSMLRAAMSQTNFSPMNASSPMISSQSRVTSWMSQSSQRTPSSYVQRDSSPASSQCGHLPNESTSHSSQMDPGKRPIQLRYEPRQNPLNRPPIITTPARPKHH